jgi:four helix bundle protein
VRNYEDLDVWEKSHQLVLVIYDIMEELPETEKFVLADQIRRASISIPSNIAEGCGKNSDAEFIRYLEMARGSTSELDYQIQLAGDLDYLEDEQTNTIRELIDEIRRMLSGLINSLNT